VIKGHPVFEHVLYKKKSDNVPSDRTSCLLYTFLHIRGGADKSLARPGMKQAIVTKLGIVQHPPYEAQYIS